jgi:lipoic acid synthetase
VITSVDRDDLPDGGASVFSQCINKIRESNPACNIEVLIPDFQFNWEALAIVMKAQPTVLNHNIETVERVFHAVRPKGSYRKSLELLQRAKDFVPQASTKSGMMVGLGEEWDEILETMSDLRMVGCEILTIGQYLQPSNKHVPISRFYSPEEFEQLREDGEKMGFKHVASGPLVRSSYHADEQAAAARVA